MRRARFLPVSLLKSGGTSENGSLRSNLYEDVTAGFWLNPTPCISGFIFRRSCAQLMELALLPSLRTRVSKEARVRSTVYPAVSTVSSSSSSKRFLASTMWGEATLLISDSVSYIALRRALQQDPPWEIPGSRVLPVTSNSSLVGKSQTLPYFPNCPPKILTLAGTNAAHLNAYSSAVKLDTVRPNSGSSLLVNGKLLELLATT
mmetsp:Transcript_34073/g.57854  ORF Transcript_34073/g.57854 Transcript_34073/m.57854 type:complete len:204 (-) Transcript_34073:818-1429(-)